MSAETPAPRLLSLDAFRGFDIVLMFFVNLSASRAAFPEWFGHAGWNEGRHGQWLADYVFPWFLYIVGVAIPFSMHAGRGRAMGPWRRLLAAARRGMVIYALGIVIWMAKTAPDSVVMRDGALAPKPGAPITWSTLLHWDILPLIGLGYALAVAIYHLPRAAQWTIVAAILIGKHAAMPDLTATAGLSRGDWMAARTDLEHAARSMGFAGTAITQGLPATATVMLGAFSGEWLRRADVPPTRRALGLLLAGAATTLAALVWAWGLAFPISKDFFTSTYVLVSAGTGAMVLAAFFAVLDAWRWSVTRTLAAGAGVLAGCAGVVGVAHALGHATRGHALAAALVLGGLAAGLCVRAALRARRDAAAGTAERATMTPLVVFGANAIFVYVLAELAWTLVWMRWRVAGPEGFGPQMAFPALQAHAAWALRPVLGAELSQAAGPWLATAAVLLLYGGACAWLYRRKIFIKV